MDAHFQARFAVIINASPSLQMAMSATSIIFVKNAELDNSAATGSAPPASVKLASPAVSMRKNMMQIFAMQAVNRYQAGRKKYAAVRISAPVAERCTAIRERLRHIP
jgi:hypothetical protein